MAYEIYQGDCLDWYRTQPRVLRNHTAQDGWIGSKFIFSEVVRSLLLLRSRAEGRSDHGRQTT